MAHPDLGLHILERLSEDLKESAIIEVQPKLEGRNMFMLLTPAKKKPVKAEEGEKADKAGMPDTDDEAVEVFEAVELDEGVEAEELEEAEELDEAEEDTEAEEA